ncbi:MAG: DUF1501 domain-containing protein, partial [Myxococcales bacterium]
MSIRRRDFLAALAGGSLTVVDWLGYFRRFGVPGSSKLPGIAEAVAQQQNNPRFLVYWFQEGGWDGYSMFNPVDTPNHAAMTISPNQLHPTPPYSQQRYRPKGFGTGEKHLTKKQGNISYGYLAQDGLPLFPDMAVVASHQGSTFHSGGRFDLHYGTYNRNLTAQRQPDERTVLQNFAESYGASLLLPHVSWHRWLSDGELSIASYPEGTGYYEKLGPAHAHTIYGRTPADLKQRLMAIGSLANNLRDARIRELVGRRHENFIKDKNSDSVRSFASAVKIHRSMVSGGLTIDPSKLFVNPTLKAEFGVTAEDEQTSATSVNGNPARSKDTPNVNVQAMMAYELMLNGLSCCFWIENREIRGFDTHRSRKGIYDNDGQTDQLPRMRRDLWTPLKVFVNKLKTTECPGTGKPFWDFTTIVLCSEMGRTIEGNVEDILASADSTEVKFQKIMDQDCCQHWRTNSAVFLGGRVKGDAQYGRVGTETLAPIPIMPDGSLDPNFDPVTGRLLPGKNGKQATSFIPDPGHLYATALHLSG